MKLIPLTQGLFTQVDDYWFEKLNQYKWFAQPSRTTFYARRNKKIGKNKYKIISMHREIMGFPENNVDHWDRNGLNNQEHNLREATDQQNCLNRKPYGTSKYKGVYLDGGSIRAIIKINRKNTDLGSFKTQEDAARAYDKMAKEHHKEFAYLNFPDE